MRLNPTSFRSITPFLLSLCAALAASLHSFAQPIAPQQSSAESPSNLELSAQFGFAGNWKLGQVCPVRIDISGLTATDQSLSIELQTVDGDGVTVTYKQAVGPNKVTKLTSGAHSLWMPIRIGRLQTAVTIRVRSSNELLAEKRIEADDFPTPLPSTQALVVTIGGTQGVESASSANIAGTATTFTTASINSAEDLPDASICYSSCDLLIISSNDLALLQALQPSQWSAIDRSLRDGGAALISLGPNARELIAINEFKSLLPGEFLDFGTVANPGPLESYVGTNDRIESFEISRLDPGSANVDLTLQDSLSRRLPWLSRHAHGLGSIQVVASDLEQPAFANWPDRKKLWRVLLGRVLDLGTAEKSLNLQIGSTSYLGYDDLVGQLRASLDVFPSLTAVTFGQAAAIIVALLLVVGPLDYFLSVKWLKRPDFSWYFAGTILTAVSVGLVFLREKLRPDEVRINSVQIVDIDATNQQATGHLWSHVYSGQARLVNLQIQTGAPESDTQLDWQGLPGRGLGGLMSQLNTDLGMPEYNIQQDAASMNEVGIPTAGTKCIAATWHQPIELQNQTQLKEISGIDQLEGAVVNPLSVDLKDCMLLYHHWYYSMPSRLAPGQSIRVSFETIPKDLPRRLNGRRVVQGNEQITPWNPADRDNVPRLLEMLMFYKAASGPTYTTLSHRYQPQLDFSNLLMQNRAILIGRVDEPLATVQVSGDANLPAIVQDMNQTWVRLVFPVEQKQGK